MAFSCRRQVVDPCPVCHGIAAYRSVTNYDGPCLECGHRPFPATCWCKACALVLAAEPGPPRAVREGEVPS